MSGQHARLSASSAHRWLKCAGSVVDGAKDETSIYAAAGTRAHTIASECLDLSKEPQSYLDSKVVVEGHEILCDQEMVDAVQVYLDAIQDDLQPGDISKAEMPLLNALRQIDPDFGGTADFVRYRPSTFHLRVMDFKFGSGMYVEVDDNEQAKMYALGVMLELSTLLGAGTPIREVEVVIVQPRFEGAAPVRSWKFNGYQILNFIADLKEAAERARAPEPRQMAAGDWCKWCKNAGPTAKYPEGCPELLGKQHALLAHEFGQVTDYTALAKALISIPLVKERIKAIEEFAYAEATAGRFTDAYGFKLVDKVPRRKWKSEGDVIEWAQANAIDPYAPKELLSPAQIEAKLKETAPRGKKKEAGAVLEPFVEKVSSGTVLVSVADNRPAAKRISVDDFAVIDGTASKEDSSSPVTSKE